MGVCKRRRFVLIVDLFWKRHTCTGDILYIGRDAGGGGQVIGVYGTREMFNDLDKHSHDAVGCYRILQE